MKQAIRKVAERLAPRATAVIQAMRVRRLIARLNKQWGLHPLATVLFDKLDGRVADGPFAGMQMVYDPSYACAIPLMVGSHEYELREVWNRVIGRGYKRMINVGCAEGFYAVGFGFKSTSSEVIAYDIDPWARRFTRHLAELNGIAGRMSVRGWCDTKELQTVAGRDVLVFCDCEGYERHLLDPAAVPGLRTSDILVEVHESVHPDLRAVMSERFAGTHAIEWVEVSGRDPADFPALVHIPEQDHARVLSEARSDACCWAYLQVR